MKRINWKKEFDWTAEQICFYLKMEYSCLRYLYDSGKKEQIRDRLRKRFGHE